MDNNPSSKLPLSAVTAAMKEQKEDIFQFLDRETREIITIPERFFRIARDWGRISGFRAYPPNEVDQIERACSIMENPGGYLPLPRQDSIDRKKFAADFASLVSSENRSAGRSLAGAVKSLFGSWEKKFGDALARHSLAEKWNDYIDGAYFDAARGWAQKNGVPYIDRGDEAKFNDVYEQFRSPGAEWRGKPFWSWNGKLDRDELIRQVGVIGQMGFGGFFMHSRTGLATEYLSDEWFEDINACADLAEKLGLEAWLYDEDRWPSGSAGGMATDKPLCRAKYLRLRVMDRASLEAEYPDITPSYADYIDCGFVAAFSGAPDGLNLESYAQLKNISELKEGGTALVFDLIEAKPDSFYNGGTYLDTLNRDATERFISLTHEKYAERCGGRLGKSIKGIFTDEPHNGMLNTSPGGGVAALLPFTGLFPRHFRQAFGYDLIRRLPELLYRYKGETVAPIKWQYMELLQRLFLENFVSPLADWCSSHNIFLTGHFLHEDTLAAQAAPFGSLMRGYELMHFPGVDVLTEYNRQYCIALQLRSAARQTGKKTLLSELYGASGWQMNFASHKAAGDWQALYGVNLRCPHLSWYTMEGEAKRDYPASIFYQSAWYAEYRYVENYFSRLGLVMSRGEPLCDVLYITPIESLWAEVGVGWNSGLSVNYPELQKIEALYSMVWNTLARSGKAFDFGDEDMIARLGEVSDGALRVGKAVYTRVLVCGMITMRSSTLALLRSFTEAGGKVVFAGEAPAYVDCLRSGEAAALAERCVRTGTDGADIVSALAGGESEQVKVSSDKILFQARNDGGDLYALFINEDRENPVNGVKIEINRNGWFQLWEASDGSRRPLGRDLGELSFDFAPGQERLIAVKSFDEELPEAPAVQWSPGVKLDNIVGYELDEPNICVLDRARLRYEGEKEWRERDDILRIDDAVRDGFSLSRRGGTMLQPWFVKKLEKAGISARKYGKIHLKFEFEAEELPKGELNLIAERPERFSFTINGSVYDATEPDGFFIDNSLIRLPLDVSALVLGCDEIILSADFEESLNLEAIYLTGDFGVRLNGDIPVITAMPDKIGFGDLSSYGFPFYGGKITYRLSANPIKLYGRAVERESVGVSRYKISLGRYEAACAVINPETEAAVIGWQPAEAVISIKKGEIPAEIKLRLSLTRRNTFGPLHQKTLRAGAYSPESFRTSGDDYTPGYSLYPAGLFEPPTVFMS